MLRWRITLGAVLILTLSGLGWLDWYIAREDVFDMPGTIMLPVLLLLAALASGEILWLLEGRQLRPLAWVVYGGNLLIVGSNAVVVYWKDYPVDCPVGKLGWPLLALGIGVLLAFVGEIRRYEKPGRVIVNVALSVFSMCYVGLLLSFAIHLRIVGGMRALAAMLVAVKMCDTGAYTVGRLIGRHKLAPVLSPGKTVEGALGGIVIGCASTCGLLYLLARLFEVPPRWGAWIIFAATMAIVGILGDLSESLFKRDMGRKDSSAWLPGFGGFLDLLDSVLFAAPVAFLLWVALEM
ncbi:MAG: phosphatidate cytidylyltransferase [Planctomycetes bacterium]|nr:phosphatidate cytidylyltransferase [Planctomycetota bacterium]